MVDQFGWQDGVTWGVTSTRWRQRRRRRLRRRMWWNERELTRGTTHFGLGFDRTGWLAFDCSREGCCYGGVCDIGGLANWRLTSGGSGTGLRETGGRSGAGGTLLLADRWCWREAGWRSWSKHRVGINRRHHGGERHRWRWGEHSRKRKWWSWGRWEGRPNQRHCWYLVQVLGDRMGVHLHVGVLGFMSLKVDLQVPSGCKPIPANVTFERSLA